MTNKDEMRKAMDDYLASPLRRLLSAAEKGDIKAMKVALDEGASVVAHDPAYGRTALHAAANGGSKNAVEHLIASGAPLDALDGNMMTPLMCACSTGKKKGSEVALLLLERGADPCYVRKDDGMDAIKFALWGKCSNEVIKRLQAVGASPPGPGFTIVHLD